MTDSYQAIYDAVRSRISNGDVGDAVERSIGSMGASWMIDRAMQSIQNAASEHERPSAVYRPAITQDGNKWCALYGLNLQEGVSGFGDTPSLAMYDFDKNWNSQKVL